MGKELTLLVLEVMKKHSDMNHPLSQGDIEELLKSEYDFIAGRKAIKSSLDRLIEREYSISWAEEMEFPDGDGETTIRRYDWYYEHDFTDSELQYLIDGINFSKSLSPSIKKEITEKLRGLSSKHFKHDRDRPAPLADSRDVHLLLPAIESVYEAIEKRRRISFSIYGYGEDKALKLLFDEDGKEIKTENVSPYRIAIKNERFYVIYAYGDDDGYERLYHQRLDRIGKIILHEDQRTRSLASVLGTGRELQIDDYLKSRVYMHSGKEEKATFLADKKANPNIVGHIIDWLGKDMEFWHSDDESVTVHVNINKMDMIFWALQYGQAIEILTPVEWRSEMREIVKGIWKRYE